MELALVPEPYFHLKKEGYIKMNFIPGGPPMWLELTEEGRDYFVNEKEQEMRMPPSQSITVGDVHMHGGTAVIANTAHVGDITSNVSTIISDIERNIEEKGGDDKEELRALLNEAKEIAAAITASKAIPEKKGFLKKLSDHFAKQGWFYGAIVQLIGTATLALL